VIAVGVIGHKGRMGSETCRAAEADAELDLVARVGRGDDLSALVDARAEVAVDFTVPSAVKDNVRFCVENGIHAVVGTSGLTDADLREISGWVEQASARVMVAPNFALGAVLMMSFATTAARYFESAEIVERHHDRKLDAPSGTSLRTADLISEGRSGPAAEPEVTVSLPGSRGGERGGVRIHSLRLPGSVAHQEVIFGGVGETLTIRHDSLDRSSFMPGVVLAIKKVASLDGLVVGLEHLLDL
jgi:4-hydroxy-tetrahydrodipicolinate reductase